MLSQFLNPAPPPLLSVTSRIESSDLEWPRRTLVILPLAASQNSLPPTRLPLAQFCRLCDGLGLCQVCSRISSFALAVPPPAVLPHCTLVGSCSESCSEVTSAETFSDSPSRTLSGSLLPLLSFSLWSSLPETVCALFVFLNRIYFFILFTTMLLEPELIAGTGMNEWENELTMDDH